MYDNSTTIEGFLSAAAAKQPAPGGGSVAALAGALAAAMGEMVVNYSIGRKSLQPFEPALKAGLAELTRARGLLIQLMAEDQAAYEALTAAKKLPESAPTRQSDLDVALLASIRIPQAMGATALAVLQLADRLVHQVNVYLLSDLAVCCELSMATVRCAVYNVRANLPDVADPQERRQIESTAQQLIDHALPVIQRAVPAIWARHSNPAQSSPPQSNPPHSNPPQSNPPQSNPPQSNPPQSNPPQSNPPQSNPPQSNPARSNPG